MADTSLIIGNGNWAVKETSLLGYNIIQNKYVPIEMTVSRNSTGTRKNIAGLIEISPKNLFKDSQTFDITASWYNTGLNSTVIPNVLATSAPNGTFTVDKLVATAVLGDHFILQTFTTIIPLTQLTVSVFAKAAGLTRMVLYNNAGGGGTGNFDLTGAGAATPGLTTDSVSIQNVGDGWYRCTMTYTTTPSTANFNLHIKLADSSGNVSFLGNGSNGIYLWGAQLEQGPTATEYFPTTDRFNIPRVDYLNSTTGSLLVEPARTNLVLQSQDLSNASWTKTNVTITANSITSPIASFNSDSIVENSASNVVFGVHAAPRPSGLTLGTTYSVSFFAKKITRDWCYFNDFNGFQIPNVRVYFNLSTGLVGTSTLGVLNPKMENYGNGWYRCSFQFVATIGISIDYRIASATSDNTLSYSGTIGQQSISVTACQLEAGSNATSYIPTTTLANGVTRAADVITKTGISSLIGQTEGTVFVEFNNTLMTYAVEGYLIRIFADANNEVWIRKEQGSSTYSARWKASGTDVYTQLNIPVINGNNKIAFAYKSADSIVYLNGVPITTPTGTLSGVFSVAPSIIAIGSSSTINFFNDRIKSATVFQTRLSNPQLGPLTT